MKNKIELLVQLLSLFTISFLLGCTHSGQGDHQGDMMEGDQTEMMEGEDHMDRDNNESMMLDSTSMETDSKNDEMM